MCLQFTKLNEAIFNLVVHASQFYEAQNHQKSYFQFSNMKKSKPTNNFVQFDNSKNTNYN